MTARAAGTTSKPGQGCLNMAEVAVVAASASAVAAAVEEERGRRTGTKRTRKQRGNAGSKRQKKRKKDVQNEGGVREKRNLEPSKCMPGTKSSCAKSVKRKKRRGPGLPPRRKPRSKSVVKNGTLFYNFKKTINLTVPYLHLVHFRSLIPL